MSRYFFTADIHNYHPKVLDYCDRPFKNLDHMHESIIERFNSRFNKDGTDILINLGDWGFGSTKRLALFEKYFNCRIWHVRGNHCEKNKFKGFDSATLNVGKKKVLLQHKPPKKIIEIPDNIELVLCGHVHKKWKHTFIEEYYSVGPGYPRDDLDISVPIINVGVDVWDYYPVSLESILKYYDKIIKETKCSI